MVVGRSGNSDARCEPDGLVEREVRVVDDEREAIPVEGDARSALSS